VAKLLVTSVAGQALGLASGETFSSRVERARRDLPPLSQWDDDGHEMQAAWLVLDAARERPADMTAALDGAVRVLSALVARGTEGDPYEGLTFEVGYFDRYPINLRSVTARATSRWSAMSLEQALHAFTTWTIETHFRVAMQKLAASPRATRSKCGRSTESSASSMRRARRLPFRASNGRSACCTTLISL